MFETDTSQAFRICSFIAVFKKAKLCESAKHPANLISCFKQVLSYADWYGLLKYNVHESNTKFLRLMMKSANHSNELRKPIATCGKRWA